MYNNILILYFVYCLRPCSCWVGQKFCLVRPKIVIYRIVVIKSAIPGGYATVRLLTTSLNVGG